MTTETNKETHPLTGKAETLGLFGDQPKANGRAKRAQVTTETERVPTTTDGVGGPSGGGVPREGEGEPKREPRKRRRAETLTTQVWAQPPSKGRQARAEMSAKQGRSEPVYVRLSPAMLEAIEKAVEGSPIEFADRSEFIRRAVENELRRRGLVSTYK